MIDKDWIKILNLVSKNKQVFMALIIGIMASIAYTFFQEDKAEYQLLVFFSLLAFILYIIKTYLPHFKENFLPSDAPPDSENPRGSLSNHTDSRSESQNEKYTSKFLDSVKVELPKKTFGSAKFFIIGRILSIFIAIITYYFMTSFTAFIPEEGMKSGSFLAFLLVSFFFLPLIVGTSIELGTFIFSEFPQKTFYFTKNEIVLKVQGALRTRKYYFVPDRIDWTHEYSYFGISQGNFFFNLMHQPDLESEASLKKEIGLAMVKVNLITKREYSLSWVPSEL